jgi:hypothetical protein
MGKGFIGRFTINSFLALDQLFNTIMMGHPDETISSRLGRASGKERYFWVRWFRLFVNKLFWFDYTCDDMGNIVPHCESSIIPLEQTTFRTLDYELWSWSKKD